MPGKDVFARVLKVGVFQPGDGSCILTPAL